MMIKHKKHLSKKAYLILRLALICLIIISLFSLLDKQLRPVITTMTQYQCRVLSVLAMNEAVMDILSQNDDIYDKLVKTDYAADGSVIAVHINSVAVNLFKARLTDAVTNKLLCIEKQKISIPLGTLLGWQLLSGRGPNIKLTVLPASYVKSEITDELETAGINQTQHSIFIHFSVQMSAILPGYSTSVEVDNELCVAQTLIVGKVPLLYSDK
ncbi:MAG: sporulation protein YunB [Oscillospiraceae bacterium]